MRIILSSYQSQWASHCRKLFEIAATVTALQYSHIMINILVLTFYKKNYYSSSSCKLAFPIYSQSDTESRRKKFPHFISPYFLFFSRAFCPVACTSNHFFHTLLRAKNVQKVSLFFLLCFFVSRLRKPKNPFPIKRFFV